MEHAFIISGGGIITPEHLPRHILQAAPPATLSMAARTPPAAPTVAAQPCTAGPRTLREIEMEHVLKVLEKHAGSKPAAANELGISLKTLYNKLNQQSEDRKAAG
jgi:DNA-binding NtrC family response regulator